MVWICLILSIRNLFAMSTPIVFLVTAMNTDALSCFLIPEFPWMDMVRYLKGTNKNRLNTFVSILKFPV